MLENWPNLCIHKNKSQHAHFSGHNWICLSKLSTDKFQSIEEDWWKCTYLLNTIIDTIFPTVPTISRVGLINFQQLRLTLCKNKTLSDTESSSSLLVVLSQSGSEVLVELSIWSFNLKQINSPERKNFFLSLPCKLKSIDKTETKKSSTCWCKLSKLTLKLNVQSLRYSNSPHHWFHSSVISVWQ